MLAPNRQTRLVWAAVGALALFSVGLSLGRIYQVDEAQNLYMARVAVRGEASSFYTTAAVDLLPLGWITQLFASSAAIFTCARLLFLPMFWLNIVLLAIATETGLATALGAWVLLGAATLAPLWDHGFEVRHENLLLSGILGMWILGRPNAKYRAWRFACIGALTVLLQFVAVKACLYTLPVSCQALVMPSPTWNSSRLRRAVAWLAGLGIGLALMRVLYTTTGLWDVNLAQYGSMATGLQKLAPPIRHSFSLKRLLVESPLLVASTLAALLVVVNRVRRLSSSGDIWELGLAEALLFLVALAAFMVNPTPFPYNLLLLVPFAYLLVVRVLRGSLASLATRPGRRLWAVVIILMTHVVPFAHAAARHLSWDNIRQRQLMTTAEALTDVQRDRVYDATGLIVTRLATQRIWYLHSLNLTRDGARSSYPRLAEVFRDRPAVVVIRSYRTDWLPPEDVSFIDAHYVPLADDFWVLGAIVHKERRWNCLVGGRYALQVAAARSGELPTVLLDQKEVAPGVLSLERGPHQLAIRGSGRAALVWLGPRLSAVPYLPPGNHERLFVNWY